MNVSGRNLSLAFFMNRFYQGVVASSCSVDNTVQPPFGSWTLLVQIKLKILLRNSGLVIEYM